MGKIGNLVEKLKVVPKYVWILLAIIVLGIFLRTYHFHAWLGFENDQVRDAFLASDVLTGKTAWPLLGPTMRGSWDAQSNLFHLGPMYYYFQIISGYIFGNYPDKLAYPDLLFAILAIPLFYVFLRKYFQIKLSLALTGLFSISFFAITYARFAWNPNSIPFFTLLFLLALYELLLKKEKTSWQWVLLAGVAGGVGVQLHVILLVLFPATAFFIFAYLLKGNWKIWKKLAVIVLVVVLLNLGQIVSELQSGFSNTQVFLSSAIPSNSEPKKETGLMKKMGESLDCHIEANAYILSSVGPNACSFYFETLGGVAERMMGHKKIGKVWNGINKPAVVTNLILSVLFSLVGYILLIRYAWKEEDAGKRTFLRLIGLYIALSFLIMLPLAERFAEFRYFIQVFFVPFIFLGFILDFLVKKAFRGRLLFLAGLILSVVILTNLNSLRAAGQDLYAEKRTDLHFAILGEMESMVKYMISAAGAQKAIYIVGDGEYAAHFSQPFYYLGAKEGVNIIRIKDDNQKISTGNAIFYITAATRKKAGHIGGYSTESYALFGQVAIYKLNGI